MYQAKADLNGSGIGHELTDPHLVDCFSQKALALFQVT